MADDEELEWLVEPEPEFPPVVERILCYRELLQQAAMNSNLDFDARLCVYVICVYLSDSDTGTEDWPKPEVISSASGLPIDWVEEILPRIRHWEKFIAEMGDYTLGEA